MGLVLGASVAQILHDGNQRPYPAKPGMALFAGYVLSTAEGSAIFVVCAGKTLQTLGPKSSVEFAAGSKLEVHGGSLRDQKHATRLQSNSHR